MIQPKDTETILKEFFDPNETFSYNLDRQAVRQALAGHLLWAAEEARPKYEQRVWQSDYPTTVRVGHMKEARDQYHEALKSLAQKITE